MKKLDAVDLVDALISHFWQHGYMTLQRKYGTYLPEPDNIGNYTIDGLAKYKNDFIIGITIKDQDFKDRGLYAKIKFLASRKTKFSGKDMKLFIVTEHHNFIKLKLIVSSLDDRFKKNIKIFPVDSYLPN